MEFLVELGQDWPALLGNLVSNEELVLVVYLGVELLGLLDVEVGLQNFVNVVQFFNNLGDSGEEQPDLLVAHQQLALCQLKEVGLLLDEMV